jgi:two-component sensor histidine kinase
VLVEIKRDDTNLRLTVSDDGQGLPEGFVLDQATGLGLSIVRTLVTTELSGAIDVHRGGGPGGRPGTVVNLSVRIDDEDERS